MQNILSESQIITAMQQHMLQRLPYGELEVMVSPDNPHIENYLNGPHTVLEDGNIISIMPALPDLPLTLSSQQIEQAQQANEALYAFWSVLPQLVAQSQGLQELLALSGNRLEAQHFMSGHVPETPFLLKSDAILATDGNIYLIDPNEIPLGLAALHGVYEAWSQYQSLAGNPELTAFIQSIQQRVGDKTLAIVSKSRGWLNHRYVARMLRHYGIDAILLTPDMLRTDGENLYDIHGNQIDVAWTYARYASDNTYSAADITGLDALVALHRKGNIDLINQPGSRVYGANYWPALLQQAAFQNHLGDFLSNEQISTLARAFPRSHLICQIPERGLVELIYKDNGYFDAEVYEKYPNMGKNWLLKMPDSTGSKGVFLLNPSVGQIESVLGNVDSQAAWSPFILQQRMSCVPNRYADFPNHKLEFWYVKSPQGLQPVSTAVMVASHQKVHGGSGTYYNVIENL